jgi:hypothetical protein
MARKLTATDLFDTLEVDLYGNEYTLRSITRSVSVKLHAAETKANELAKDLKTESAADDAAEAVIGLVDIILEPVNGAPPAGEVLREMWEGDKLGLDFLTAFAQSIQEEANARRRPTSPSRNSS